MQYRIAHGHLETASTFGEKEATSLIERIQPYFSIPLKKVPVEIEEKPRLTIVEGGRK